MNLPDTLVITMYDQGDYNNSIKNFFNQLVTKSEKSEKYTPTIYHW